MKYVINLAKIRYLQEVHDTMKVEMIRLNQEFNRLNSELGRRCITKEREELIMSNFKAVATIIHEHEDRLAEILLESYNGETEDD